MSLATPSTKEISDNIIAQLEASLNQSIPLLPKSFLRVLAKVIAGVFILLYKYGGFMFLQLFVSTASDVETEVNGRMIIPLREWGRLVGVGDPEPATHAELSVEVTVKEQVGTLPAGTQLIGSVNGVTYLTVGSTALNAPTVQATVRAVSDQAGGGGAGIIGNLNTGDIVSFANPLSNVARDTVVVSQSVTAADAESTEAYRHRVSVHFAKRPQGGAYADYEDWGEEVAGIINVYPYTSACPGQVDVYSEATPESSGNPDGIPTLAQLQAVWDSIELDQDGLASRRPANALVNSYAISRGAFDIRITGLDAPNLTQVKADIEEALTEYFFSTEPFINGLSLLPRKDRITESSVTGIVDDVVTAAGGIFTHVFMKKDGLTTQLYTLGIGEKAKLGNIIYV